MIVSTMTPAEIQEEIAKDNFFLESKILEERKIYLRSVRNVHNFPFMVNRVYVSKATNISYTCVFFAPNKYKLKNPYSFLYTKFTREEGNWYVCIREPDPRYPRILILTSHFLQRYQERMNFVKDYTKEDLVIKCIMKNRGTIEVANLIKNKTKYKHDDGTEIFTMVTLDGILICEREKESINVEKALTFISPDLFFQEQDEAVWPAFIAQTWSNFVSEYPPQREKLFQMFYSWAKDPSISTKMLWQKVNKFISEY